MPRLVVTNLVSQAFTVGNPDGFGQAFTIPSGGGNVDLTDGAYERAQPQLNSLVTKGKITFTTTGLPSATDNEEAFGPPKARVIQLTTPAAKSTTNVHAAIRGDTSIAVVTTGLTSPDVPRNLRVTFGATHYDGGNVTVVGTDQFDAAATETFTATPGSTIVGVKIFKTVTSTVHALLGTDSDAANTYSVGTGDKLAVPLKLTDSVGLLFVDGVGEAVTWDATLMALTPTTAPNGTHVYKGIINQ